MIITERNLNGGHLIFAVFIGWESFGLPDAQAVPSMGRQLGVDCATCHTVFPELTPFGRAFKLSRFSLASKKWEETLKLSDLPLSALVQVSYTQTHKTDTDGATPEDFPRNKQIILEAGGFYLGGRIYDNLGALVQYNYNGIERKWGMEMFDMRYGNDAELAGRSLAWGVSMNNTPTLSDIYNSTPNWEFPHTQSATLMPAAATLIDMTLASQVGGVFAYALWDDTLYGEFGFYHNANTGFFRFMSLGDPIDTLVHGNAPYWRFAWQKDVGPHGFELGTYGMAAKVFADSEDQSLGSDRYRDIAFDASYHYLTDEHQFSAHATWIHEKQDWNASFNAGLSSSPSTTLETFRADVHHFIRREFGGGIQYFRTHGDTNDLRYNTGAPVTGSANGSPNSSRWLAELDWLPIQNLKLAVRYTAYWQFNGSSSNYDGFGRNAKDNNSVFLLAWLLI
jgi:hypothetical protein